MAVDVTSATFAAGTTGNLDPGDLVTGLGPGEVPGEDRADCEPYLPGGLAGHG
jgi:hypothetical protein